MKIRSVGRAHLLLFLTGEEAAALGISAENGCALFLQIRTACLSSFSAPSGRCRVKAAPHLYRIDSCSALLDLLERLCRRFAPFPCALYRCDDRYFLLFTPPCRELPRLRRLFSEYGARRPVPRHASSFFREHGDCLSSDVFSDLAPVFPKENGTSAPLTPP